MQDWVYVIRTGRLYKKGQQIDTGYSGHGQGLNNPDWQDHIGVGPLPIGDYRVSMPHTPTDHLGPVALPLVPLKSNEMHGRSGFFMHGDNSAMNHSASNGCLIFKRITREAVHNTASSITCVAEEADREPAKPSS